MTSKTQQCSVTDPNTLTTWATTPTSGTADLTRLEVADDERLSSKSGTMLSAPIAANRSAQDATGGDDTVMRRAPNALTDNVNASGPKGSVEFGTGEVNATPTPAITQCERCGAEFVARRPWTRFCSAYCRRMAWLDRHPERAAELAKSDKARLRAHIIGNNGEWGEGTKVSP